MVLLQVIGLVLFLAVLFYLLAKVCDDYFVPSLDKISERLNMSDDAAGATLMAIGSSAPELFIAIIALVKPGNHEAIGMGTIVGSALFNILVIIGAVALVRTAVLTWQVVIRDTIFYVISIVTLIMVFWNGQINLFESVLFVALYIIYVLAVINWDKILPHKEKKYKGIEYSDEKEKENFMSKVLKPLNKGLKLLFPKRKRYILVFTISIIFIAAVSWALVESAVVLSELLHIPSAIIALTVLAAGTSIPDMMSSLIVARQGRGGMAISNAIGSNIFDIFVGLGVPWLIMLSFGGTIMVETANLFASILLLFATVVVILFLLIIRHWKIGRYAGWFLILLYVAYVTWTVMM